MRINCFLSISFFLFIPFQFALASFGNNDCSLAREAVNNIKTELTVFQLQESDLKISPGWELPLTIPTVENFFNSPLHVPIRGEEWSDKIEKSTTSSNLFNLAFDVLQSTPASLRQDSLQSRFVFKGIPDELSEVLNELYRAILTAQPLLQKSVYSLSPDDRRGALSLSEWPVDESGVTKQDISSRRIKQKYENMRSYSQNDLLLAGQPLFKALDIAIPRLKQIKISKKIHRRFKTPAGVFMVRGSRDDIYTEADLKGVTVLIDLGGRNTYKTPPATAYENQIRVVIDMGDDVSIQAAHFLRGGAGVGIFGIGIFALPNQEGTKRIATASFSQGCGIGGIGALIIEGTAHLTADRYSQGVGVFGIGILNASHASSSTYAAARVGQGAAMTRGLGIFKHEGNGADIRGGLTQPDPREPKGSVSVCQGVGFGHRAYAGGGVGLAVIQGNDISVKGSYFSQGCGYWHSFGVFRIRGNQNTIQSRRYDMGSGVHNAFGHFELLGNNNRVLNWGVGPAYGWDRSIGSALFAGENNEVQVDWGSGVGSIGSLSFSYFKLNKGRLKLCDWGRGQFFRNESSYSIQILDGEENKIQCLGEAPIDDEKRLWLRNIRGLTRLKGAELVKDLGLAPADWPEMPQEKTMKQEMVNLQTMIRESKHKAAIDEIGDLLDIASAFSLDKKSPRDALNILLALPSQKISLLPDATEPAAIDQLIQLNIVFSALGDEAALSILEKWNQGSVQKQATLIHFLRVHRPSVVFPRLLEILRSASDRRIRSGALRTMASLLNRDTGQEPGFRALLETIERIIQKPDDSVFRKQAIDLLSKAFFFESFGLLSVCSENLNTADRQFYLSQSPADLTSTTEEKSANALLKIIENDSEKNSKRIQKETAFLNKMETVLREECQRVLKSTQTSDIHSALLALGQIAHPEDVKLVAPFIDSDATHLREAASVALGRFGDHAIYFLDQKLSSGTLRSRIQVLTAIQQNVSANSLGLLKKALADTNPVVRLTAVALINDLPEILSSDRDSLILEAEKRMGGEKDPHVKRAISLLR